MTGNTRMSGFLLIIALTAGCGRNEHPPTAPPPATTAPATSPTTAAASVVSIGGVATAFPPGRAKIDTTQDGATVQLFTDESALLADATANTVLLSLPVQIDSIADLSAATCHLTGQATDADNDSPNGLFLNGGATQLMPLDVNVVLSGDATVLTATLDGTFLRMAADQKEQTVVVKGSISAVIDH